MADRRHLANALVGALALWIAHAIALAVAVSAAVGLVESLLPVFENTDVDLPTTTVLAIDLSNYCRYYWYTLVVPLALDAALLVGLHLAPSTLNWLAWFWSALWFLGTLVFLAFISVAISMPVAKATEQLRGG